ncbi:MAG: leucine-rich repeat domain-containing protein [Coprococcus sp.]
MKKIINVIWVLLILGAVLDGTQMRVKAGNLVYGDYEYSQNPSDKTISIIKYNGKDSEVEIPQKINGMNVVSISEEAFQFNDTIVDVVIPEGVTGIGSSAFSCCSNLKQVSFPDSLEKIGFTAFYNCESLENIYIPENVNTIATEAFSGCSNIKKYRLQSIIKFSIVGIIAMQ